MAEVAQPPQIPHGTAKKRRSWSGYVKEKSHELYEAWVPWIEDLYLRWFTKDNKASYTTKDTLAKTKVTGIQQVDNLQDGVHNLVGGQVGKGGLAQPLGDSVSREGMNRAERGGKDERGGYAPGPAAAAVDPLVRGGKSVNDGGKAAAGKVGEGVGTARGYVGGLFGGKK